MFSFDPETHIYCWKGEILPSVTGLMSEAGLTDYSMVPSDKLEYARLWGSAVHKMTELYLKDSLEEDDLDELLRPSLWGLKNWLSENGYSLPLKAKVETPGFHPKLKYAGTPDIVFPDLLIEVKTRPLNSLTDSVQCAAYDGLDGGSREHKVLVFFQDGTFQYRRVNSTKTKRRESWSRFRYILELHKMRKEIARWK